MTQAPRILLAVHSIRLRAYLRRLEQSALRVRSWACGRGAAITKRLTRLTPIGTKREAPSRLSRSATHPSRAYLKRKKGGVDCSAPPFPENE
ncbi:hypothetical protein RPC_2949 [Rhodopseudomonas palustris BisB18]|uniref:Uncharacterized protein n=1 Tax=Rhodopseudomonas palustris (strain BisB18) TaxID=316056 RepID=Q213E2_RHOPB